MKKIIPVLLILTLATAAMALEHRRNTLIVLSNSRFAAGSSYTITAFDKGAMAEGASSGTTITVDSGHGFTTNEFLIVGPMRPPTGKSRRRRRRRLPSRRT